MHFEWHGSCNDDTTPIPLLGKAYHNRIDERCMMITANDCNVPGFNDCYICYDHIAMVKESPLQDRMRRTLMICYHYICLMVLANNPNNG